MCLILGGKHLYATDTAENNGLIDAFGSLTSENANPTQKALQVRVPTPRSFACIDHK
jgi:hypothetical protein